MSRASTGDSRIPDRKRFKAAEVCSIAQVPPYVLKSWEGEFPHLGASATNGGRVYRRQDVELVLEIRRLLFEEGLTLGAARRKLVTEKEAQPAPAPVPPPGQDVRECLLQVQQGLRSILDLLSAEDRPKQGT